MSMDEHGFVPMVWAVIISAEDNKNVLKCHCGQIVLIAPDVDNVRCENCILIHHIEEGKVKYSFEVGSRPLRFVGPPYG